MASFPLMSNAMHTRHHRESIDRETQKRQFVTEVLITESDKTDRIVGYPNAALFEQKPPKNYWSTTCMYLKQATNGFADVMQNILNTNSLA